MNPSSADTLNGAGSSAAAPVYKAWAAAYAKTQTFELRYDPAGSSAGVKKIRAHEVDFGASDVAVSAQELERDRLVLVPTFITGATPVVNLPKLGGTKLRLTGEVLSQIFLGHVNRWNAPEIQSLNLGLNLPDLAIKPVVRSDGSGTTYYFTSYLSKVSPAWNTRFGTQSSVAWPAQFTGAKGSDGVAKALKEVSGSIGYIDFNYVATHDLQAVQLRNAAGEFVMPSGAGFRAALLASEWSKKGNFHAPLVDLPGNNVWPITMGTFIVMPKVVPASGNMPAALRFFVWSLLKGDQVVEGLSFVRLPDKLQALAFKAMSSISDTEGQPLGLSALGAVVKQ